MKGLGKLLKGIIKEAGGLLGILLLFFLMPFIAASFYQPRQTMMGLVVMLIFLLVVLFVVLTVYGVILWMVYRQAKDKLYAVPGFSEERFLREIEKAPRINRVLLCSDAICYADAGYMVKTVPIKDIVWAYQEQVQRVPYVQIYTKDREKYSIPVTIKRKFGRADAACRYVLRLIARKNTGVLIGYDENYDAMCKNAFSQLLARAQQGGIADSALLEQEYVRNNYYARDLQ